MMDPNVPPAPPGYIHFKCQTGARGECIRQ